MSAECAAVHKLANVLVRHGFPYEESTIPLNGIYFLFQKGEIGHKQDRIVRVGTHTGNNQLPSRIRQHFINKNKDRSIFRKNIGRALLNQRKDPFLKCWEIDMTTRSAKDKYADLIDSDYQKSVEKEVSSYIKKNFTFSVVEVSSKEERLEIESRIISTVSWCNECRASDSWLGNSSPKEKIVDSGLWLVNELYKTPLDSAGIRHLSSMITRQG